MVSMGMHVVHGTDLLAGLKHNSCWDQADTLQQKGAAPCPYPQNQPHPQNQAQLLPQPQLLRGQRLSVMELPGWLYA